MDEWKALVNEVRAIKKKIDSAQDDLEKVAEKLAAAKPKEEEPTPKKKSVLDEIFGED